MAEEAENKTEQADGAPAEPASVADPATEARIAQLETEFAKAKDDLLRALAEAENTRRRAEKQANDARVYAIDRFANDLLPIADTLSRALEAMTPDARANANDAERTFYEGVELTERALIDAFARHGLKRMGTKGEKFDPNLHQAVAQIPSDVPANHIAEVMQPGFVLGDRTVRAAIVAVSAGQAAAPPSEGVDIKV
jgi:molecular chaperone GrpE